MSGWDPLDREVSSANMWLQEFARHLQGTVTKPVHRSSESTFENHFMTVMCGAIGLDSVCSLALCALKDPIIAHCYFIL